MTTGYDQDAGSEALANQPLSPLGEPPNGGLAGASHPIISFSIERCSHLKGDDNYCKQGATSTPQVASRSHLVVSFLHKRCLHLEGDRH